MEATLAMRRHSQPSVDTAEPLSLRYSRIRALSEALCAPLELEDFGLQGADFASPAKWHLAHTSWFFETFLLKPHLPGYRVFHPRFEVLFNSYYHAVGEQYPRPDRGLLSRPTVAEVSDYRSHVDTAMATLLAQQSGEGDINTLTRLGCDHEQQHQELLLTDLKYSWHKNPLLPVYCDQSLPASQAVTSEWHAIDPGLYEIGHRDEGFAFDNESPAHSQYLHAAQIARQLVSNADFLAFMRDGGYQRPELWLSDGWAWLQGGGAGTSPAPLYWQQHDGEWFEYTLHGLLPLEPNRPAAHLNAYEADAYARWAGARLPTEFEWEVFARQSADGAQFYTADTVHPTDCSAVRGALWQWTSSAYSPYPGFRPAAGAVGEYNGKFMANQLVLRGGSCATSVDHYRDSYRNFFYPPDRWQFTGLRLARD